MRRDIAMGLLSIILCVSAVLPCSPTKSTCFHKEKRVSAKEIQKQRIKLKGHKRYTEKYPPLTEEEQRAHERARRNRVDFQLHSSANTAYAAFIYNAALPDTVMNLLLREESLHTLHIIDTSATTLSPRIAELQKVKRLTINAPNLIALPKEIGAMHTLKELHITKSTVKTIEKSIMELPNLKELTIEGDVDSLPPIPARISRVRIPNGNLKTVSWYLDSTTDSSKVWQYLDLKGNPIDSLPRNLLNYIWRHKVRFYNEYVIPAPPTTFTFDTAGAYLTIYNKKMPLDSSLFTIQWYEKISGPKSDPTRDTLRTQCMYHPSGLPVFQGPRSPYPLRHGAFHSSQVHQRNGKKERRRSHYLNYLSHPTKELPVDTTYYRDTAIDAYHSAPRKFRKAYRTTELNAETALFAEVAVAKKSGDTVCYTDGTPYLSGDWVLIRNLPQGAIQIEGRRLWEDKEKKATPLPMNLNAWLALSQKEKERLYQGYRKEFPLQPRVKHYYKLQALTGGSNVQPFALDLSATLQWGRRNLFGFQLFATPGIGAIKGGAGLSYFGSIDFLSNGIINRVAVVHPFNDKHHLREELYVGPEIGWQGGLFCLILGRYYSTESDHVQNGFYAGVDLGTVRSLIKEHRRITQRNRGEKAVERPRGTRQKE